jgi:hypothetical protein
MVGVSCFFLDAISIPTKMLQSRYDKAARTLQLADFLLFAVSQGKQLLTNRDERIPQSVCG